MYNAYITRLKNVRKHPNADRLQLGECFGNTVCVSLDYENEQLGVYFPTDGQLSEEFCEVNNLVRKKDDAGNNIGGYMEATKRNVCAIRLRGEKSDGLFLPLSSLAYTGVDISTLGEGFAFTAINGKEICQKYIPRRPNRAAAGAGNRTRKKKASVAPLFAEHADTEQLAYNLSAFKPGDEIEITLKMHGTSGRTARLPVLKGYKRTLLDRILRREGTPIYEDGYVSGTRRVVLENYEGGFYGDNSFRERHSRAFEGKLHKGETVYYEIVSFTDNGTPIMGKAKVPKESQAEYGKEMVFHYGCHPEGEILKYGEDERGTFAIPVKIPKNDMYVYRMTLTTDEGYIVEYTPDMVRRRCEEMGVKTVPVFWKGIIPEEEIFTGTSCEFTDPGEFVKEMAERFYDGPDPIGKTHVREGVVVRIINRPKFTAFKHKNFLFKQITGIITEQMAESAAADKISDDILSEM
jgi:hypothetical protein